jgi:dolichol-phosphate mannosyltransferase
MLINHKVDQTPFPYNARVIIDVNGASKTLAVVIPCYKVTDHILEVIKSIPEEVDQIIVVDDGCPNYSGDFVLTNSNDERIVIIKHGHNSGIGAAMKSGYSFAIKENIDVVVKVDGDGQMDMSYLSKLVFPILNQQIDYTKGNRFFSSKLIKSMPKIRIFGNVVLSFMSKLSTGFYEIFDPNNGFTAISREALNRLEMDEIDDRFFFESDMLFQLSLSGCTVKDIPIPAIYGNEKSNLKIVNSTLTFFWKHNRNFLKRVTYEYFVRDFSVASLQLVLGLFLGLWGCILGFTSWYHGLISGLESQPGRVVFVAILCVSGLQLLLSFINFDINSRGRAKN